MNLHKILFSVVLIGASATVLADGGGSFRHDGKSYALKSAYAYTTTDHFDKNRKLVGITLSDALIDGPTLDAASDRGEAMQEYLRRRKANSVTLELDPADKEGPVRMLKIAMDGYQSAGGMTAGFYAIDLKRNDGKRIEGTFRTKDDKDRDGCDVHFAVDIVDGAPFGPALPPDGGEPYKAFGKFSDALFRAEGGHYGEIGDTVSKAFYQGLLAAQKKGGDALKQMVRKMWDEHINYDAAFMQGRLKGDVATFEVQGAIASYSYDDAGNSVEKRIPASATVTMKKEDGAWVFDGQTLRKSAEVAGAK